MTATLAIVLAVPVSARGDALPDGRVYEQVSPATKNGFEAGSSGGAGRSATPLYGTATADGSGLFYGVSGPIGEVRRGLQNYAVARRRGDGWQTTNPVPAGSLDRIFVINYSQHNVLPSSDLSKVLWNSSNTYVPDNPSTLGQSAALYMGHEDGSIDWLSRPLINNPLPAPGQIPSLSKIEPVGGSPDLSTVYFWSQPTLLPQDAARAGGPGWGMYEYDNGVLKPAGTLPGGSESPGGAAPASAATADRDGFNFNTFENTSNQVSRDGSTLLFVSPDPGGDPAVGPTTQLYVRRGGHSTLVSHDENLVAAPSGASPVRGLSPSALNQGFPHQYAYGSPDGKKVIFQSHDPLTSGAPNDGSQKVYRYDVDTDTVQYLPDVDGTVVASSDDGGRFLFKDPTRIALWDGGTVTTIATVPSGTAQMSPARATASGSVFVFSTRAAVPGFNNGGGATLEIYRYDVAASKLSCVSCPPDGVALSGDAHLSNDDILGSTFQADGNLVGTRGISDDGQRVFFDTPDALRPRDTNGLRDVYEWTPSGVSLISTGRSQRESLLIDSSASGDDVFFSTVEGLDPADTDASYDVYDARIGGGFNPLDVAAPCVGDACQGGVSSAPSLPTPGSTVASGVGNQVPPAPAPEPSAKLKLGARTVSRSTMTVTVTIARPGRVSVTGGGLRSLTKSYATAGMFKITVPLTAAAKHSLKSKHRLALSVRVGFSPQSGPASSVKFVLNAKA